MINSEQWANLAADLAWLLDGGYGDKKISELLSDIRGLQQQKEAE